MLQYENAMKRCKKKRGYPLPSEKSMLLFLVTKLVEERQNQSVLKF